MPALAAPRPMPYDPATPHSTTRLARRLTLPYAISLLLVAAPTTGFWLSFHSVVDQQTRVAVEVNVAGRQRMLSQRIGLMAAETLLVFRPTVRVISAHGMAVAA